MSELWPPHASDSLVEAALKVLNCPDPWVKADYTYKAVELWRNGSIRSIRPRHWRELQVPDRPARADDRVRLCAPGEAPRRGKGGTLASRQALLHSAVHIENWAVDLSWDVIARWGLRRSEYNLPRAFFDDFVRVAEDECRHFTALAARLQEIGSHYGAFPVHDGLWESAAATAHSLPARLAVEHCCHEARGLDVLPSTVAKFANNGDAESAALLRDVIYPEEITHCAAGVRWIRYLHDVAHGRPSPLGEGLGSELEEWEAGAGTEVQGVGQQLGPGGQGLCGAGADTADSAAQGLNALSVQGAEKQQGNCPSSGGPRPGLGDGSAPLRWDEEARRHVRVEEWFHTLIRQHFYGALKPPFNDEARAKAGFGPEWYLPLATKEKGLEPPGQPHAAAAAATSEGAAAK